MSATYASRISGINTAVAMKAPVRVATTANITLSGLQTIDGITVVAGDRVLVKNQTAGVDNGIWTAAAGAWSRALDFNGARDVVQGTQVYVVSGTVSGTFRYVLTTADPDIGTTALTFVSAVDGNTILDLTGTADAFEAPRLVVTKSDSPLDYSAPAYNAPAAVLQWSDDTTLASNGTRDGFVFRDDVTNDGSVTLTGGKSGGSSASVWRGVYSGMNKSGDGSGHSFTGGGELQAYGGTGYNELGLFVGTGTNTGSIKGTIHGVEVLVRDGTGTAAHSGTAQAGAATTITLASGASAVDDAYNAQAVHITGGLGSGQYRRISDYVGSTKVATVSAAWSTNPDATSTYEVIQTLDTYLVGVIGRVARYYGGSREAVAFLASAEGVVECTAILKANNEGTLAWNTGIDFEGLTFSSGQAVRLNEGDRINWTDGANDSSIRATSTGNIVLDAAGVVYLTEGGTLGGPALAFEADPDTGIYRQGANVMGLVAGGVEGIRVLNNNIQVSIAGAALATVTLGAADSGGAGFKVMRVPN